MCNIQYRIWDRVNKRMISWDEIIQTNRLNLILGAPPAYEVMPYIGLLDCAGRPIYKYDLVVIPEQYPWYDDGVLNYIGSVRYIYQQWQVVYNCVNKDKRGISDGLNIGINNSGFEDHTKSPWLVLGNVFENPKLLLKQ